MVRTEERFEDGFVYTNACWWQEVVVVGERAVVGRKRRRHEKRGRNRIMRRGRHVSKGIISMLICCKLLWFFHLIDCFN